jgi:hypothetical protein
VAPVPFVTKDSHRVGGALGHQPESLRGRSRGLGNPALSVRVRGQSSCLGKRAGSALLVTSVGGEVLDWSAADVIQGIYRRGRYSVGVASSSSGTVRASNRGAAPTIGV